MTTEITPHDLMVLLNDALAEGSGALVITIEKDASGCPVALRMNSTPVSSENMIEIAEFAVERAIAHCHRLVRDGSADARLPHLSDALLSLQAATSSPEMPTIGRA